MKSHNHTVNKCDRNNNGPAMTGPIFDMINSIGCAYSHVRPMGARNR